MNKYKVNIILILISLLSGIFIGRNLTADTTENIINAANKTNYNNSQVEFYDNMIEDLNTIEIYDTSELTADIMANRNGKIVVEKIIGEVVNSKLDGRILNCDIDNGGYTNKDGGNYISYARVDGARPGDKIVTYYIYNPFSNAQDDVLTRLDFIIDCNEI